MVKSGLAKWVNLLFLVPMLGLVLALGCGDYKGSDCAEKAKTTGFCVFTTDQEVYEAEVSASNCADIAGSATVDPGDPVDAEFKFVFWTVPTLPEDLPDVVVDQCRVEIPVLGYDSGWYDCGPWKVETKVGSDATLTIGSINIWGGSPAEALYLDAGIDGYTVYLSIGARPPFSTNYVYETNYAGLVITCKEGG